MLQNKRKTIGVMICDIVSDYQDHLCQAISSHANELGYNVAIFACFADYGSNNENAHGEYNILNLPPYENLDALLICADTYPHMDTNDLFNKYIDSCHCPIVCIRRQIDDNYSVLINDVEAISEIVHHFVHVHKFTRIAFMSGPAHHPDSIARLDRFKAALKSEGITFNEDYLFEGDFWKNKGKEAAKYYTDHVESIPEAIVCANDYMAISLCSELVLKGFVVPDDIAVSGYDNITDSVNTMPPLTTLSVSPSEMAKTAVNMIHDLLSGKTTEKIQYVKTKIKVRNSCGCNTLDMTAMTTIRINQLNEYERIIYKTLNNFTSISLQKLDDALSIGLYLKLLDYEDNRIRNFFLCLGEANVDTYPKYSSSQRGYAKHSYSVYSILNRKEIETSIFETSRLIPAEGVVEEPITYFFFPLHYLHFTFGYIAISYYEKHPSDRTLCNWISTISNSLENLRVKNQSKRLVNELNNLYVHDSLTGLYNRRGFEQLSIEQFDLCMQEKQAVMILGVDMDNLKTVNDVFGHSHGDLALKTIAEALKYAAIHNETCARMGGDEFSVIGPDYNDKKLKIFIDRLYEYLSKFNKKNKYNYAVDVSYGSTLVTSKDNINLEECIKLSDKRLYEQKRAKKNKIV